MTGKVTPKSGQVATAATNPVTGDRLVSRAPSEEYKDGWDRIFGAKKVPEDQKDEQKEL